MVSAPLPLQHDNTPHTLAARHLGTLFFLRSRGRRSSRRKLSARGRACVGPRRDREPQQSRLGVSTLHTAMAAAVAARWQGKQGITLNGDGVKKQRRHECAWWEAGQQHQPVGPRWVEQHRVLARRSPQITHVPVRQVPNGHGGSVGKGRIASSRDVDDVAVPAQPVFGGKEGAASVGASSHHTSTLRRRGSADDGWMMSLITVSATKLCVL